MSWTPKSLKAVKQQILVIAPVPALNARHSAFTPIQLYSAQEHNYSKELYKFIQFCLKYNFREHLYIW